jgi:hypothetical protein
MKAWTRLHDGASVEYHRREGLAQSRRQHELMIELLKGRDSWALAQLCVDHMPFIKSDYLARIAGEVS